MRFTYATGARPLEGFTIKRGIGIGGFGQVYYAVSDAGKEVALKHIQRSLDVELRGVGQCLNLKHPNLLALYDIRYDEAGEGWVVMEYVTGENLADVIQRNPNGMPHDQIAFWFSGMAAGIACLHDHGIVHRDVKPGNIFNDAGIVKVGDYGLSKFISVSRRSAQTESVGTFHYMAPEIGKGRYGREIDVYALGVILFEMLTGDVPFDGETSQEIIMKHLTAEPKLDHVGEPYRAAIARALEKDPEKRLSSVPEMLSMLNIALPNLGAAPVIATPPAAVLQTNAAQTIQSGAIVDAEVCEAPHAYGDALNVAEGEEVTEGDEHVIADDDHDEPLYIGDSPQPPVEIEFGPLEHRSQNIPRAQAPARRQSDAAEPRPLPTEPIARTLAIGWRGIVKWFSDPNISSPLKALVLVAVLVGGIPLLMWNPWAILLLLALGIAYGVYYAIRAIVISSQDGQKKSVEPLGRSRRWQQRARDEWAARPWAQRLSELTGSLLMSAAIAGVASVIIMILAGSSIGGAVQTWGPQLAWVVLATIGGAWSILLLSKWWERSEGDQVLRRVAMLAVGMCIGAVVYGLDASLYVDIQYGNLHHAGDLLDTWHAGRDPTLPAYLAYFGGLFAILRWWLQADPLRKSRFSLWATVLSALWGFIIPFPQPWGIMLAIAISLAVQLSAPWITSGERNRLRQQLRLQDARA